MSDEQRDLYVSDRANFDEAHARALATGDGASALNSFAAWLAPRKRPGVEPGTGTRGLSRASPCPGVLERIVRGRSCALRASPASPEISLKPGAGSTKPTRCSKSSGTGTGAQTRSGRDASSSYRPETSTKQSSSPNGSPRSSGSFADADRAGAESEAQWALAWALLGRAVEDNDRSAAERSRALFAARADAAAAGTAV